ncbi:restriction endonuclease [Scytonema hofmannii PCC 7110]|uniref:Restriction endonuclease n=1 Tax=Scytonema hofmannii PCC 7110 TaxID=128403 RepID=A0A139X6D4_9CYAN|nr:AvaI/BsoBI family type II restriction endonuclease [Scytonema hofmannii]KYC40267.1 restriction endonuclease [Scytonema hofmannii PCC 7110]
MSYYNHLHSSNDLVTTYEEVRAGFVALALERNRKATPFLEQARSLKIRTHQVKKPQDLLQMQDIRPALLAAAGISDKAAGYLQEQDKIDAIEGLIKNFLEPVGEEFLEELVYRFLLTRGDTLGGMMRNIGGVLAERKFTRAVISALRLSAISYKWLDKESKSWLDQPEEDTDIELRVKGLSWVPENKEHRTLMYNIVVPIVRKNIDICLFNCNPIQVNTSLLKNPNAYIALGELKGGIDPAGADEHWKTANSALERIRSSFKKHSLNPCTFFVGAAIENSMAEEIWHQLNSGKLSNAANLTYADQVASLCAWLITL